MTRTSVCGRRLPEIGLPALGVGLTYSSAIEPLLEQSPDLADVIEVEPQTVWTESRDGLEPYRVSGAVLEHLARLPGRKLVHSVGTPVGGTVRPEPAQLALLRRTIVALGAPWVSDHLSFNSTLEFATGFFLPPRQTAAGVETVVRSILDLKASVSVPVAVETGVNYLRPRPDEMLESGFIQAVVEAADCGLLLDLHNIFTNGLNGRQGVDDFLARIPLDRVWEVHLAGGFEMEGFWLDAHSGAIPRPLLEIARRVVPSLPNLKALIFEIFPSFVPAVGLDTVRAQVDALRELWTLRTPAPATPPGRSVTPTADISTRHGPSPAEWERALGALVIGRPPGDDFARGLAADPGVGLIRKLICEFRASMIVGILRLTVRLVMLALSPQVFRTILEDFWSKAAPRPFASAEAEAFAGYLAGLDLQVPHLAKVLEFERAVLSTLLDQRPRTVAFESDPFPLLRALADGRLPDVPLRPGRFEIDLTPDGPVTVSGLDVGAVRQVFPFH